MQLIAETIKLFNDFVEHIYDPKSDNLKIICTYIQTSWCFVDRPTLDL